MKELSTQNSIPSENNLQESRGKQDILRRGKLGGFVISRPTLKEWLKEAEKKGNLGISGRKKEE